MDAAGISNAAGSSSGLSAAKDKLGQFNSEDFLKLFLAELQHQDPLNPTDNNQILQQIGQIRSIQTTTQLDTTLQSVLLGQNLSSASGLIDKFVRGLTDDGEEIRGRVDRVSIEGGQPILQIGERSLQLKNLRELLSPEDSGAAAAGAA